MLSILWTTSAWALLSWKPVQKSWGICLLFSYPCLSLSSISSHSSWEIVPLWRKEKKRGFDVINCEMFMFKMELLCMFFDLGMKEACEIIFFFHLWWNSPSSSRGTSVQIPRVISGARQNFYTCLAPETIDQGNSFLCCHLAMRQLLSLELTQSAYHRSRDSIQNVFMYPVAF